LAKPKEKPKPQPTGPPTTQVKNPNITPIQTAEDIQAQTGLDAADIVKAYKDFKKDMWTQRRLDEVIRLLDKGRFDLAERASIKLFGKKLPELAAEQESVGSYYNKGKEGVVSTAGWDPEKERARRFKDEKAQLKVPDPQETMEGAMNPKLKAPRYSIRDDPQQTF
jgi:hypothetical protein